MGMLKLSMALIKNQAEVREELLHLNQHMPSVNDIYNMCSYNSKFHLCAKSLS